MNARDACIRSVFPLRLFRINRAITSTIVRAREETPSRRVPTDGRARDRSRRNPLPTRTKNPPPRAPTSTRFPQPIDVGRALARACTPSVSTRVPPSMCVPRVHTYPFHPPLDGPGPVDRDTSTAHARGKERVPPPPHKKQKKRKEPPSPLTNAKINTHGVGRRRIQPTRGSVRSPRAPACAMDNDRCHVSGPCGSCVPSTRTGHDSRKNDTPTTDRAYASASSSSSPFPLVRSTSRVVSARRTCTFDSLDASNALDRHPSHRRLADSARALRRRARARRGRKPRASTDATDRPPRRPRPTTTTDDESIRTQGRRYGTRARLDAIDRPEARACRRVRAFAASASSTTTATEVNTASCRCDTRLFEK